MAVPAVDLAAVVVPTTGGVPATGGTLATGGLATVLEHPALVRLGQTLGRPGTHADPSQDVWSFAELQGRLCQLTPDAQPAVLTLAVDLVRQAQATGETAAWVAVGDDLVYAPDVAACGVDLAQLPVVRAGDAAQAGRAADLLLRSGAFGLVVVDLGDHASLAVPLQSRLVQLALKHEAAVVCLARTRPEAPSLGSLVSLRAVVGRRQVGAGRHVCRVEALKDKRQGPGWQWEGVWHGADGLA